MALTEDKNSMKLFSLASSVQTFQKLAALPDICSTTKLLMQNDAETNFEFLWHSLNDYYAFFELRNIDWQQAYNTHRSQVTPSTTPEQLVEIIEDMIGDMGDGHVSLTDNDTFAVDAGDTKGFELEVYRSDFVDADKDPDDAYDELRTINDQVLISLLENQQLKTLDDADAIRWGKMPGNVGYLRIDRVADMGPPDSGSGSNDLAGLIDFIKKDLDVTDLLMKEVMTDLTNTDGMIVDLRFNDGGFDAISLKIASYFSGVQQVIGTKQVRNKNHQGETLDIVINAAPETAYSKPVYVAAFVKVVVA